MANEITPREDQKRLPGLPLRLDAGELTPAYEDFLTQLRDGYPPGVAIRRAGLKRTTTYTHRKDDDAFREAWDDAYEMGTDAVYVAEAARRGVSGVLVPQFYKGKVITDAAGKMIEVREYSDRLLEFLLTARRPREFAKKFEVSGPNGEAIRIVLSADEMAL